MKILIAKPIEICRFALRTMVTECEPGAICAEAGTTEQLNEYLAETQFDSIIIEPTEFLRYSTSLLLTLSSLSPDTRVLIVSNQTEWEHYLKHPFPEDFQFLPKELSVPEQKEVLRSFLFHDAKRNQSDQTSHAHITKIAPTLTDRETEILSLIATGKTAKQIGDQLFISPHTAQRHRKTSSGSLD